MALQPISPRSNPYGFFDVLDSKLTAFRGGEVVGLTYVTSDKKANDVLDGYVSNSQKKYPALTGTLVSGMRPLFLTDDGLQGYGMLFGSVIGTTVGQDSVGTVIGPHTALASGKLTVWDEPGFYTVTLDAVDTNATTGLQPTNTTLDGNAELYATVGATLTPNIVTAFESLVVARFIEFTSNKSLVTTPLSLVSAPNSPIGGTGKKGLFDRALIHFDIED